jgi:hypothetical protein
MRRRWYGIWKYLVVIGGVSNGGRQRLQGSVRRLVFRTANNLLVFFVLDFEACKRYSL